MTTSHPRRDAVLTRIRDAEARYHRRAGDVNLLAVSKRHAPDAIRSLHAAGQEHYGENYLQEALDKQAELTDLHLVWHFVGALQSNKTREAAAHFDWVHTVDRERIARRLGSQRPDHLDPLQVCIQVNVSGEPQKAGCEPEELRGIAEAVADEPRLRLRGLMTLPEPANDFEVQRQPFAMLRGLFEALNDDGFDLDTLSMGMSADLEAAIAEGATWVRVGTALFGPRTP